MGVVKGLSRDPPPERGGAGELETWGKSENDVKREMELIEYNSDPDKGLFSKRNNFYEFWLV